MNIGIIIQSLQSGDRYRGIGSYTRNLLENLEKGDLDNQYTKLSSLTDVNNSLDLIIIPYFTPFKLSLPVVKKTKILVTIHDLIPILFSDKFPAGIKGNIIWNIQKLLLKQTDSILTDSYVSKKDILERCGLKEQRVNVIYPSVSKVFKVINDKNDLKRIINKYHLPDKFILYVGDCNWNKNIPTLIKAVKNLNLNLILAGKVFKDNSADLDHPWNQSLKEVLNLSQSYQRIKFLGYIPESDLKALYNLAQIYIQPSFYEGFGLPVVEALSCGCPVIASDCASLKEIAGDSAIYFDPKDVYSLVKKITLLSSNSVLKESLRKKGFIQIQRYSPVKMVKDLKYVYQKIL